MKIKKFPAEVFAGKWLDAKEGATRSTSAPLALDGVDCLEIFSANAKQTVYFFCHAFGFTPVAYRGPEVGYRDAVNHVLRQGDVNLIISAPMRPTHPMAAEIMIHGITVKNIALRVPDCEAFYYESMRRGAVSVEAPREWSDEHGKVRRAGIRTYGETIHSIVERKDYRGAFWPGFLPYAEVFPSVTASAPAGITGIDHVVGNVALGDMGKWVSFYERVLGFTEMLHFSDKEISTEYSALMSKVVRDGNGKVKFPINEPAEGKRKSQIEEYLEFHYGPGVQHVALATQDIIKTVSELRARGVHFLSVPRTYYDDVPNRVGEIRQDLKAIAELGILVDRDDDGYLLQLFTKPVHDRPTLFFEIIQREGSQGFGKGNFKALFEAIERDQALRGNL